MSHYESAERQAMDALQLISYDDPLKHWLDFHNLPKITTFFSKEPRAKAHHIEKNTKYSHIKENYPSKRKLKPLLVLKAVNFD